MWNEAEYDTFVQTVRRHGKDKRKVQEALLGKTARQIKKFRKALSKQIDVTQDHPESDILTTLLDFSDEEDDDPKNVVATERRRKKLARKKRKMVGIDLCAPYLVPKPPQRHQAPALPIEKLEQTVRYEAKI